MSSCNNLSRTIVGDSLAPDKSQVRWPTRPTMRLGRRTPHSRSFLRLSLRKKNLDFAPGKAELFRTVLRQSRLSSLNKSFLRKSATEICFGGVIKSDVECQVPGVRCRVSGAGCQGLGVRGWEQRSDAARPGKGKRNET
jgi:hypothetical protein